MTVYTDFFDIFLHQVYELCEFSPLFLISAPRTIPKLKMPQTNYTERNLFITHPNYKINNRITVFNFHSHFCKKKKSIIFRYFLRTHFTNLYELYILKQKN